MGEHRDLIGLRPLQTVRLQVQLLRSGEQGGGFDLIVAVEVGVLHVRVDLTLHGARGVPVAVLIPRALVDRQRSSQRPGRGPRRCRRSTERSLPLRGREPRQTSVRTLHTPGTSGACCGICAVFFGGAGPFAAGVQALLVHGGGRGGGGGSRYRSFVAGGGGGDSGLDCRTCEKCGCGKGGQEDASYHKASFEQHDMATGGSGGSLVRGVHGTLAAQQRHGQAVSTGSKTHLFCARNHVRLRESEDSALGCCGFRCPGAFGKGNSSRSIDQGRQVSQVTADWVGPTVKAGPCRRER